MTAITNIDKTLDFESIREEIRALEVKKDELRWIDATGRKQIGLMSDRPAVRNIAAIDRRIEELKSCLPEWIARKREATEADRKHRIETDVRALGSYTDPQDLKDGLQTILKLRAMFERVDLQGHCRFAVRDLNTLAENVHATLSDFEASQAQTLEAAE